MKIRNGFVSNSSSSSFIILKPSDKELTKEKVKKFLENLGYKEEYYQGGYVDRLVEYILEKFGDKGELFPKSIEYGTEHVISFILDELGIKYLDLDEV